MKRNEGQYCQNVAEKCRLSALSATIIEETVRLRWLGGDKVTNLTSWFLASSLRYAIAMVSNAVSSQAERLPPSKKPSEL